MMEQKEKTVRKDRTDTAGKAEKTEQEEPLFFEDLDDLLKTDAAVEAAVANELQSASDKQIGAAPAEEPQPASDEQIGTVPADEPRPASDKQIGAAPAEEPQPALDEQIGTVPADAEESACGSEGKKASEPDEPVETAPGKTDPGETGRVTRFVTAAEIAEKRGERPASAAGTGTEAGSLSEGSRRKASEGNRAAGQGRQAEARGNLPEAGESSGGRRDRKRKKLWKRILVTVLILLVLAAAGVYAYGVRFYSEHFLPATSAEGVALDHLTVQEAEEKLTASKIAEDSSMELLTADGETVLLDVSPLRIRRHYLGVGQALAAQQKWLFFLHREEPKLLHFEYEISYDREKTEEALKTLAICDPEKTDAPVNAMLYKEDGTGIWKVLPAYDGNRIDTAILAEAVAAAVDSREKNVAIADTGAYRKAEIREDDPSLLRNAEVENAIDAASFTVDLGADTVYTVTSDEFRSLLTKEAVNGTDFSSLLDEAAFVRYLDRLSRNYSTKSGSGYRYFHSVTGAKPVLQVDYGWDMNEEETGAALYTMLEEAARKILTGEDVQETYPEHCIAAVWDQTAISHGERDVGSSWVEVDITNQVMYCVIDQEIALTSDVVTGLDNTSRRTPTGIYAIRFKTTERDLVGYNRDGTEAYRSHVHYWMPFNKNIGLHDATWRYAFGGKIYKWSGSHGCVNMPLKAAKELYSLVYKDMPVIVYK